MIFEGFKAKVAAPFLKRTLAKHGFSEDKRSEILDIYLLSPAEYAVKQRLREAVLSFFTNMLRQKVQERLEA